MLQNDYKKMVKKISEPNFERKRFGKYLREIRLELHITIKDLAEIIGFYPNRMSDYELAKTLPTQATLEKIVKTYADLSVSEDTLDTLTRYYRSALHSSSSSTLGRILRE